MPDQRPSNYEDTVLEIEIRKRFGVLPNFFRLSREIPEITANLWGFAQAAYLDNPLPSLFKERLFVYLSRFCEVRYCIARHIGFLVGLGRPAGDAQARIQTVDEVVQLLKRPLSRGEQLKRSLSVVQERAPLGKLPEADSDIEEAFFAIASHIFLQTSQAPACLEACRDLLDAVRLENLILLLLFIRSAHYWTKVHPELVFEEDIKQFLASHEDLAECVLNDPEALVSKDIANATVALRESEELVHMAVQAGRMIAYEWDAVTDKIVRSEGIKQILGEDEQMHTTGQQILNMIPPEDRERLNGAVAQLSPENPILKIMYRMVRKDGRVIWVDRNSRAYFDEHGKMLRLVGMIADITERKRAEEAVADLSQKLLEAQEQERRRIGRELHDDINQRLALLSVEIQRIREANPITYGELRSQMDELGKRTSEISAVVQTLSHELHSSSLEYLSVASAMRGFCKEFGVKHKVEVAFDSEGMPSTVPNEISLCLFRVMQEGLQNALKHSRVRLFEVKLHGSPTEIRLIVRDSGVGFDPELVKDTQGLGLVSMRERVRLVNGTISVTSGPQSGTEINVRVPLSAGAQTNQTKLAGA